MTALMTAVLVVVDIHARSSRRDGACHCCLVVSRSSSCSRRKSARSDEAEAAEPTTALLRTALLGPMPAGEGGREPTTALLRTDLLRTALLRPMPAGEDGRAGEGRRAECMGDGRREAPGDGAREHGREPGRVVAGREGEVSLEEGREEGCE